MLEVALEQVMISLQCQLRSGVDPGGGRPIITCSRAASSISYFLD